jgi:type IV pilus modification protein PilV
MTGQPCVPMRTARGFTLVEVLVALIVLAFGMMALAGFQTTLSANSDLAKQRTEATRLAQEKLEELRSFEQIASATGKFAYADLSTGNDTPATTSNTAYARSWVFSGSAADAWRSTTVSVAWTDRGGEAHTVRLESVIARTETADVGALSLPTVHGGILRRPQRRDLGVPVPALSIGGGRSTAAFGAQWMVFADNTGEVTALCATQPTFGQTDFSGCTPLTGYLLAGFINDGAIDSVASFAWTPDDSTTLTATQHVVGTPSCIVEPARDPNNVAGPTLPDFLFYTCLIQPSDHDSDSATPRVWTGRLSIRPLPSGSQKVCRFDGNGTDGAGVYNLVPRSLDNQNYLVLGSGSCPSGTTQHQP